MKFTLLLITSLLLLTAGVFAQGCSDAGFCSLGVLKNNVENPSHHTLSFGSNYGLGEQSTSTINPYIEYGTRFNNRLYFLAKITATYASGFLGSNFDAGDVYGSLTYSPNITSGNSLNFIGGIKIPLSTANDKNSSGKPLSLDYQASIGTYDAILGVNYIVNKTWEFDAGAQLPFYQHNKNTFFPNDYTDSRAEKFAPSNNFRRNSDLLGRVGYYINFQGAFVLKPNLLLIYHTGNDTYQDHSRFRQPINGSKGVTLNGALTAVKTFKNKNVLEVVLATPFVTRKVRADGLTRDLVVNLQYSIVW